jgi:hypothetical protein
MRKLALLLVVLCSVLVLACGGGKHLWAAQPVSGPVTIQPQQVYVRGGKLWVRTNVINGTNQPIMVDRDQIIARLPNGAIVHRASGSTTVHTPYMLPPGAAHAVYVEFFGEGFDWRDVPGAQIDFSPGVTTNGQPMQIPPLMVANAR